MKPDCLQVQEWLSCSDEKLLGQCEIQNFQGSGNGGQKRNRVYSGVRLIHKLTQLQSQCCEHREALRNKEGALKELRRLIAFTFRHPYHDAPAVTFPGSQGKISLDNPLYPLWVKYFLDVLNDHHSDVKEVSFILGTSHTALLKLCFADKKLLEIVQKMRQNANLPPLRKP